MQPGVFRQYLLTGTFLEASPRSQVVYLFRRLRPTLALSCGNEASGIRFLDALSLHSVGTYARTWAGALCPTDDVIAHLMYMRGDEHGFWKKANQHSALRAEAGI